MKWSKRAIVWIGQIGIICWMGIQGCLAQANLMQGKNIGIYISSSNFTITDGYYMPVAQFLSIEEDRSSIGEMKAELMIRVGELLSEQLIKVAMADSVYFLNADIYKGRYFQKFYSTKTNRLTDSLTLENTDLVLVINKMDLSIRQHRSVYIRSNQMYTQKIPVKVAEMSITLLDPVVPDLALEAHTCFDEQKDKKVEMSFDFYQSDSKLGLFFSYLFSRWWYQLQEGELDNCYAELEE